MKPTAFLSQYRHAGRGAFCLSLRRSAPLLFLGLSACALSPPDETAAGVARAIGTEQVRDPLTGRVYFVTCNPCAVHTPKTVLNAVTRPVVTNDLPGGSALPATPLAALTPNLSFVPMSVPVPPTQVRGNESVAIPVLHQEDAGAHRR
jgi:hypothetical protein